MRKGLKDICAGLAIAGVALLLPAIDITLGCIETAQEERAKVHTAHVTSPAYTGGENKAVVLEFYEPVQVITTAYCGCKECCGWDTGITYSGKKARPNHTIAANLEQFPLGTVLEINGTEYTVEDTGRLAPGVVDIYFSTHEEAVAFGVQKVTAYKK